MPLSTAPKRGPNDSALEPKTQQLFWPVPVAVHAQSEAYKAPPLCANEPPGCAAAYRQAWPGRTPYASNDPFLAKFYAAMLSLLTVES